MSPDKEIMVQQHMALATKIARQMSKGYHDPEDLVGQSQLALVEIVEKWSPDCKTNFRTYAIPRIKARLAEHKSMYRSIISLPKRRHTKAKPITRSWDYKIIYKVEDSTVDVENQYQSKLLSNYIESVVNCLPERERNIVVGLYYDGYSEEYLAGFYNISQQAIHKTKMRVLAKLRRKLTRLKDAA